MLLTKRGLILSVLLFPIKSGGSFGRPSGKVKVPLVADIHFDYRLALTAMESGIDALRINPGNIGKRENVIKVVTMAKEKIFLSASVSMQGLFLNIF